ncbi:MAG: methyl-accepting chemotaxis protein [Leptospira sp.]|nr:methyl-accepting chemotaxis protein [Leptospira sp.]
MTIKQRLAVGTSFINLLTLGIILIIISIVIYNKTKSDTIENLNLLSEKIKLDIVSYISTPLTEAYLLKKFLEDGKILDRNRAMKLMNVLTASNESILGTYLVFEPNAYDGLDAKFRNTTYHDNTGRFIPYSVKSNGSIIIEPVIDYDKPESDFYQIPKTSKKVELIPPFQYKVDGKEITMVSLVYPILQNDKFVGIAGADLSLETIQGYFQNVKLFNGECKITIIASNGYVLFNGFNSDKESNQWENGMDHKINDVLNAKNANEIYSTSDYLHITSSITLIKDTKPWVIRISYPLHLITGEIQFIFWLSLLLGGAGIIFSIIANYIIFHKLVDIRLQEILKFTERASKGDLTQTLVNTKNDEMGNLVNSLGLMIENIKQILTVAQTSGGELSKSTNQLEKSIFELSDLAQSQAASSEEASATVEQLNASSETINGNVTQAVQNTKSIHGSLTKIQDLVQNVTKEIESFGRIAVGANQKAEEGRTMAAKTSEAIVEIQEKSQMITEFSDVISNISERTSLLALNAAIEAARAGESGRGFAVVAEEISKLAAQAADSVSQINNLSEEALTSIDRGGEQVSKLIQVLREITTEVSIIFDKAKEIIPMIQDQKLRTDEIFSEMNEISQLIIAIQQSTEEQKRATEELSNMTINISNGSQILSDQSSVMNENSNGMTNISTKLSEVLQKFVL